MTNNNDNLEKEVVIGGSEHLRDSDIEESLVEGVIQVGDALAKGTAETQVVATPENTINFKGIALGHSIRQSDTETLATALTAGKTVRYLKPTGGRVKVRAMAQGFDSGATVASGAPVYFNSTGSTITQTAILGDFFIDPACTDNAAIVGRLSKPAIAADTTSNNENVEIEMWY